MEENEKIRVLIKEPYKPAYLKEIENTLKGKQELVGGYIECVTMPKIKGVSLYVNEEGKLDGLLGNFWLPEYEDCVVGTCFMVGYNSRTGELKSITDKQVKECLSYIKYFEIPENKDLYADYFELKEFMKQQKRKYKSLAMEM